jgi:DNA helicase-2/ATP-dependent DNA helicase PcrA
MTRAKEELHLLHATRRSLYGQPTFNKRSRFIEDIPEELYTTLHSYSSASAPISKRSHSERPNGKSPETLLSTPRENLQGPRWSPPFRAGQKVKHAKFGIGVVLACNPIRNDSEITVAFPGVVGIKKLLHSLAKLEPA